MMSTATAATAFHEAGHTVAGHYLGRSVVRVSIAGDEDGVAGVATFSFSKHDYRHLTAGVDVREPRGLRRLARRQRLTDKFALLALAGWASEREAFGTPASPSGRDLDSVCRAAAWMAADDDAMFRYLEFMANFARAWVRLPPRWRAIESLASMLLDRQEISGADVRRIIAASSVLFHLA